MEDKKLYTIIISILLFLSTAMLVMNLLTPVYSIKYHQHYSFNGSEEHNYNYKYFYNFAYEEITLKSSASANDTHVFKEKSPWPRVNYILISTGVTQIVGIIVLIGYGFFVTPFNHNSNLRMHQTVAMVCLVAALLFTFVSLVPYGGMSYAFRYSNKLGTDHTCIMNNKYIHQCKSLSGKVHHSPKYVSYSWGYDFGWWMELFAFIMMIAIVPFNCKLNKRLNSGIDIIQIPNDLGKEEDSEYDQFVLGLNKDKIYSIDDN
ncbi:hypothetical protein PPL_11234 [Heterostelium album PN500]|uniref:Transmembrane protein n=1 Tax=Heterostelium pallidum (strain ATCC 26659 / Pp 5 / PN500) TaxID=670386 RepID=D3BTX4_HETP5|nr:hypothetical protein PPL_11234 [Heterostelium album PN500]EFA75160.1 hypothetical protein PPL_11234 [Heterostelium album PN500]|eukprot:XP_020427294.1 hypothetical protein PPL_11234 [Heterostelium album PN500]